MSGIKSIACEYDLRGRKTYEGGATYPVRYEYDTFGNKTSMTTYRTESVGIAAPSAPQGGHAHAGWRWIVRTVSMLKCGRAEIRECLFQQPVQFTVKRHDDVAKMRVVSRKDAVDKIKLCRSERCQCRCQYFRMFRLDFLCQKL